MHKLLEQTGECADAGDGATYFSVVASAAAGQSVVKPYKLNE